MWLYFIIASIVFGLEVGGLIIFDIIDEDEDDISNFIGLGIIFAIIWPFSVSAALAGFMLVKTVQKFDFYKKK